ncbi:hypothetical protein BS50DRAFT_569471 [Corynespora cassiicola Philippines]|uniref:Uncharacterized protein n=1 Tax=Corynespora cassiicola Philippines TaxID=1448308 RepID=A0A2T2P2M6_CORCC|nr:hypothetical protein BS50DRAFT_569471 [Corynespora cassiicola Philippines]
MAGVEGRGRGRGGGWPERRDGHGTWGNMGGAAQVMDDTSSMRDVKGEGYWGWGRTYL